MERSGFKLFSLVFVAASTLLCDNAISQDLSPEAISRFNAIDGGLQRLDKEIDRKNQLLLNDFHKILRSMSVNDELRSVNDELRKKVLLRMEESAKRETALAEEMKIHTITTISIEVIVLLSVAALAMSFYRWRSAATSRPSQPTDRTAALALQSLDDKLEELRRELGSFAYKSGSGQSISSVNETDLSECVESAVKIGMSRVTNNLEMIRDAVKGITDGVRRTSMPLSELPNHDIEQRNAGRAASLDAREVKLQLREDQLSEVESQVLSQVKQQLQRLGELTQGMTEADRRAADAHRTAQDDLKQASNERKMANADREQASAEREMAKRIREETARLQENAWPASFQNGPLAQWREQIEHKLKSPNSAAPLLYATLYKYAALCRRDDDLDIDRTLQEVSRFAYQFWQEMGLSVDLQEKAAEDWKRSFEIELGGKWFLRVVHVGEPKDPSWMDYTASSAAVATVQTWCVQHKDRRNKLKAQVT